MKTSNEKFTSKGEKKSTTSTTKSTGTKKTSTKK